jgi:hypothetical protein
MSKSNLFDCLKEDISSDSNSDDNKSHKRYYKKNYNRKYTKINENKPLKYKKHDIINNDNIINKEEKKSPKYSPKNYKRINYLNDNLEEYKKESPANNKFNKFKKESPANNKFKNDYKVSKKIKEENEIKSSKIFNKMKCTKEFTEKIINNRKFYNEDCNISYSIKDCIYNKRSLTLKEILIVLNLHSIPLECYKDLNYKIKRRLNYKDFHYVKIISGDTINNCMIFNWQILGFVERIILESIFLNFI